MSTSSTHQAKPLVLFLSLRSVSVGASLVPNVLCCPVVAGVQWGLEGQTRCDQVRRRRSGAEQRGPAQRPATGDELVRQTHSWNLYG